MKDFHELLKRQISIYFGENEIPQKLMPFFEDVNSAYIELEVKKNLEKSSKEHEESVEQIKRLQAQIVQQEKMADIGQLSAGIAHEINNPLGFVKSNIYTLENYKGKIKDLLELYLNIQSDFEHFDGELYKKYFSQIDEYRSKNKISFILSDIDDIISETEDGINRIQNIVKSLLGFARKASTSEFSECDINNNINSTVTIAYNEIKYHAQIQKNLENIPLIRVIEGEINQVILNLLMNAAYAIKLKGTQGIIKIHTYCEDEYVKCSISDNGIGISEDNLSNIFNPFFTTKPVGIGTGLGLSISNDIIANKHGGNIEVRSILGEGTTFIISLPINSDRIKDDHDRKKSV